MGKAAENIKTAFGYALLVLLILFAARICYVFPKFSAGAAALCFIWFLCDKIHSIYKERIENDTTKSIFENIGKFFKFLGKSAAFIWGILLCGGILYGLVANFSAEAAELWVHQHSTALICFGIILLESYFNDDRADFVLYLIFGLILFGIFAALGISYDDATLSGMNDKLTTIMILLLLLNSYRIFR